MAEVITDPPFERRRNDPLSSPLPHRGGVARRRNGGDHYDRRSRSPPPRFRDFKRRRPSFSPPPPPYRDRRRGYSRSPSPPPPPRGPRRSPPRGYSRSPSPPPPPPRGPRRSPPYKRARREDYGGGRRGGPRGRGRGPGDWRHGYEYHVDYERETEGRLGYRDERPPGRLSGHSSSGRPDWDTGRVGFADAISAGSNRWEGLMSYKQFIQELEDDILPTEAERRYQEYKSSYIEAQKRAYFDAHKDEEWLKDKYHPTNLTFVVERRNELAQKLAEDFALDLRNGKLDLGPAVTPSSANKSAHSSEANSEEESDAGGRSWHGRGSAKNVDLLSAAPKAHQVSCEARRIQFDIEQAQALVRKLDSEKGIEDNKLSRFDNDEESRDRSRGDISGHVIIIRGLASVRSLEGTELLDTLLTYLWRIHGVDYYGMTETHEAKGLRHVRAEGNASDATANGVEWEKKLDTYWQVRLKGQDPLELMTAKEQIDAVAVEGLDPYVRKIKDDKYGWKYGCGAKGCTKLFHATEFVHKHLKLKHPDLVMELTSKVCEDLYFQNYLNDENAPGGTPVISPSLPKEKAQRHRPGLDGRVKDDRENHRDFDGQANGGEKFHHSENHQPGEFQSKVDGADVGEPDELTFDSFNGQGIPVAPFLSDVAPPQVLMPVPGAGLLGPFVPAPPEIALQMFREQGGPTPFNGSRNVLGSVKSRLGPRIAGPPAFRQDPRHLRSYQDLDALEDEVTVIDYRSL